MISLLPKYSVWPLLYFPSVVIYLITKDYAQHAAPMSQCRVPRFPLGRRGVSTTFLTSLRALKIAKQFGRTEDDVEGVRKAVAECDPGRSKLTIYSVFI